MAEKEWYHRLHGDDLHDLTIFLVERHVVKNGGRLKPTKDFRKKYICPAEPDVFFEFDGKLIEGNRRTNQKMLYVVEVETKATNQNRLKKYNQYKESLRGLTDLIVIDLDRDYCEWNKKHLSIYDNWLALTEFISEKMPI